MNQKKWWQNTVVYQVYPRSFYDSNGDGCGDLEGIIRKLDYLQQLGVETIWLSPFFESPGEDVGYDISNYKKIDPVYGRLADADRLIKEVHRRGMKVIFDMVLNHTSDRHPWFLDSRSSKDSRYRDWYMWRRGRGRNGRRPPNNWKSLLGERAWKYDPETGEWFYFHFFDFQPDLNYRNPAVKKKMFDNMRFWLDRGVDGFRLDILHAIYSDPLWRDNPRSLKYFPSDEDTASFFQDHRYDLNMPETFDFARQLRSVVDEYKGDRFLVGEVFGTLPQVGRFFGEDGKGLNQAFVFKLASIPFKAARFYSLLKEIEQSIPWPKIPALAYSNHDRTRMFNRMRGNTRRAAAMATIQFTLRGVPYVYYGEETGMLNSPVKLKDSVDPLGRRFKWLPHFINRFFGNRLHLELSRDTVRSPMQWTAGEKAGFSEGEPWLPVAPGHLKYNVELQSRTPDSIYHVYRNLIHLRRNLAALGRGTLRPGPRSFVKKKVLTYQRISPDYNITVYVNFSRRPRQVEAFVPYKLLFSSYSPVSDHFISEAEAVRQAAELPGKHRGQTSILLKPYEAQIHLNRSDSTYPTLA